MSKRASGKLIVFEGADGSGKTTQAKLLLKYLKSQKIRCAYYTFPRYDQPWGKIVKRYLDGEFGGVGDVNPYLASVLYAGDRAAVAEQIRGNLKSGKIVVCDRYIASNIAHQVSKIKNPHFAGQSGTSRGKQSEKSKFVRWLEDFEYNQNKIPKEDVVILLSVDPKVSQKLMRAKVKDIHEKDEKYLAEVVKAYESIAKSKNYWQKVECVQRGEILSPGLIFEKVLSALQKRNILRAL